MKYTPSEQIGQVLGLREGVNLEFKREQYTHDDEGKRELLKDICGMANSGGGKLFLGIKEDEDGRATDVCELNCPSIDNEVLWLENVLRTNIEPRVVGLKISPIDVGTGSILVLEVPQSSITPHMMDFKKTRRFYKRNSNGVHEMSVEEMRAAFSMQSNLENRVLEFIKKRFVAFYDHKENVPLPRDKGVMFVHIAPLGTLGANIKTRFEAPENHFQSFAPIGKPRNICWRHNLDGIVFFRSGQTCRGYTQLFRNGFLEATKADIFREGDGNRYIARDIGKQIIQEVPRLISSLDIFGFDGPFSVSVALECVGNTYLRERWMDNEELYAFPRSRLDLGDFIVGTSSPEATKNASADLIHVLWNAFGYERCIHLANDNLWSEQHM